MKRGKILFVGKLSKSTKVPILSNSKIPHKFVWYGSNTSRRLVRGQLPDWKERKFSAEELEDVDRVKKPRIAFIPSSDTHVKTFYPITKYLEDFRFLTLPCKKEGAEEMLNKLGIEWETYSPRVLLAHRPDVVAVANDWGLSERAAVTEARALGIPTVCIQEGSLDFANRKPYRMKWADFAFVQGPVTPKFLDRESYFITGNPRFDSIKKEGLPKKPLVVINLNFTYGVEDRHALSWIRDVVWACKELGLDFFISRHPRDKHEFPGLPVERSDPVSVYVHLLRSSILVTRFSTLVYEAALMGRGVVYYNPHGEDMRTFNEDDSGGIEKACNRKELKKSLAQVSQKPQGNDSDKFVKLHCTAADGNSSKRCSEALSVIPNLYKIYKPRDMETESLSSLRLKMFVFGIMQKLS